MLAHPPWPAENLQQGQLGEGRDCERATGKEAVRPLMVLVLWDDERDQSVGIEQVAHPSLRVAAFMSST